MKIILISWPTCVRCHAIKPFLERYAERKWYEFEEIEAEKASPELIEWASMLPIIYFWDERIEFEEAMSRIAE